MQEISGSLEDYLEAIYFLNCSQQLARVKKVADFLGVKQPSVVNAYKELSAKNLITQESYGAAVLTAAGKKAAQKIGKKHKILTEFLHNVLGVERKTAEEDACRIEHVISDQSLVKIQKFLNERS